MANIEKKTIAEIEDKSTGSKFVISSIEYYGGEVQVSTDPEDKWVGFLGETQATWTVGLFYVPWARGGPVTIKNQVNRDLFLVQFRKSE